eukprot:592121-Ditylum_brightwellii.AAC.1
MSANRCPFSFYSFFQDDTHRKDLYTPFDIRLNLADANSLTALHSIWKLNAINIERILMFIQLFDSIVKKASIPEGGQC